MGGSPGSARRSVGLRLATLWILGCSSTAVLLVYIAVLSRERQVDFDVYQMGGQHVLGTGLYSSHLTVASNLLFFTYPPLAAMLFWPFSHLPTVAGQVIWDITNVVALTALIAVSSAAARGRPLMHSDWQVAAIALAPTGILLWPVRYDLMLGQINIGLVLMIVIDLTIGVSWRGRRLPKGLLVGAAAGIKLTPLIFIPFMLVTRQWHAAKNATLMFVMITGVMMAVAPKSSWNYFTKYAFDVRRVGDTSITTNQTLHAAIARAGLAPSTAVVDVLLLLVLCAGMALAVVAYDRSSPLLAILLCAATGLVLSPISWQHHYVWCVPLLVWLVFGVDRPRRGVAWAAVAAIVFLVIPPGQSDALNVLWYVRENAYVIAALGLTALAGAMLWSRNASTQDSDSASLVSSGTATPWSAALPGGGEPAHTGTDGSHSIRIDAAHSREIRTSHNSAPM